MITGDMYAKGPLNYCGYCKELQVATTIIPCKDCKGDTCPECVVIDDFTKESFCVNCADGRKVSVLYIYLHVPTPYLK